MHSSTSAAYKGSIESGHMMKKIRGENGALGRVIKRSSASWLSYGLNPRRNALLYVYIEWKSLSPLADQSNSAFGTE